MRKYVIERTIPGAGCWSPEQLAEVSRKSNEVLRSLGTDIQWLHSYVVDDKVYCIYHAASPDIIMEHARCGGFPADKVSEVKSIIDPTTGG